MIPAPGATPLNSAPSASPKASTRMADESDDKDKDKDKKDDTLDALVKGTQDEDPQRSARAKRALASYLEDGEKAAAAGAPARAAAPAPAPAAVSPEVAVLTAQLNASNAKLGALSAQFEQLSAARVADQRASMLAARPDLTPAALKALEAVSTESLAGVLAAIPVTPGFKPLASVTDPAALSAAGAPVTAGQPSELDIRMGLVPTSTGAVLSQGNVLTLGAPIYTPPVVK